MVEAPSSFTSGATGGRSARRVVPIVRGLAVSAGILLTVNFLGAARVGTALPVAKPVIPALPTTLPASAARPAMTARGARAESPKVELLRDVKPTATTLARASAVARAPRLRTIRMEVTAYCPCTKCCGPDAHGVTASGLHVSHNGGRFVAADTDLLQFGTRLRVPGYDDARPVEVIDRGGAIKGHKLDVYFPSHQQALEWGRQVLDVTVLE
jgi:3D (Asp-Asp-Asp) domain-containing protein